MAAAAAVDDGKVTFTGVNAKFLEDAVAGR
jgi:hypothetical protein